MTDPNPAPQPAANPADPTNPTPTPNPALDPAPNPDPAPAAKAWGETWRQELAGGDDKALKQLERFTNPKALWDSYQSAYQKIRSGEVKAPLPDKPTPEQLAAYRQERGIPEKPEGYLEKLPNGLVIGDDDKPIFESLVKKLHEGNADPKTVHGIVEWYQGFRENAVAEQREADMKFGQETEDDLRAEWGAEYRINKSIRDTFVGSLPEGIKEVFLNSRMPDGRLLGDHADLSKWLVQMARDAGMASTIVSGTGGNQIQSINDEIAKFDKLMGNPNSEYWKGQNAEKNQSRYRELVAARERMKARAA